MKKNSKIGIILNSSNILDIYPYYQTTKYSAISYRITDEIVRIYF